MIKLNAIKIGLWCMLGFGLLYCFGWIGLVFLNRGEGAWIYASRWTTMIAIGQLGFLASLVIWIVGLLYNQKK